VHVNTSFASIKELQFFNERIAGSMCPDKRGLDVYLHVMSRWAKGNGLLGPVKEVMGMPRLTFGLLIKPMCTTYAKMKPLIDHYRQSGDNNVIESDYAIQVWLRKLLARCVALWIEHSQKTVKVRTVTNAIFLKMGKNNVDLYFLQGVVMLCVVTNTDFRSLFNDYVKVIEHDIDHNGFIPAEARGDKSLDYIVYTLPPIIDTFYYFNLIYGLKVKTDSELHKKMTRMFERMSTVNLNTIYDPAPTLVKSAQDYQRHIVQVNKTKNAALTFIPANPESKNIKTPDGKSQYVAFNSDAGNRMRGHKSSYEMYVVGDIDGETKESSVFTYIHRNPSINRGFKMQNFLSIVGTGPIIPLSNLA
jgi:hypothetical protein